MNLLTLFVDDFAWFSPRLGKIGILSQNKSLEQYRKHFVEKPFNIGLI